MTQHLTLEILSRKTSKHCTVIHLIDQSGLRHTFYATDFIDALSNGMDVVDGKIYGKFRKSYKGYYRTECIKYVP